MLSSKVKIHDKLGFWPRPLFHKVPSTLNTFFNFVSIIFRICLNCISTNSKYILSKPKLKLPSAESQTASSRTSNWLQTKI